MASRWSAVAAVLAVACDATPAGGPRTQAVIGGEPVDRSEFPATGALIGDGELICTGTLIAPDRVVTAAHCLVALGGRIPGIAFATDLAELGERDVYSGVAMYIHPDFDYFDRRVGLGQRNDIGLVILGRSVAGRPPEVPATASEADAHLRVDAPIEFVGYGVSNEDTGAAGVKLKGTGSVRAFTDHELLVSAPGEPQSCHGDSGGPGFVTTGDGDRRLLGIVSRGPDAELTCDRGAIETRIDAYLEWVTGGFFEMNADAGPPPDAAPDGATADAGVPGDGDGGGCAIGGNGRDEPLSIGPIVGAGVAVWATRRRRRRRGRRSGRRDPL